MSDPAQFLLLLDVDAAVDDGVVMPHLAGCRSIRRVLRLTDYGVERRQGVPRDALDWTMISAALASMVDHVRTEWPDTGPVELYVAGFAPLSVFFAVGALVDARNAHIIALQPDRSQPDTWRRFVLTAEAVGDASLHAHGVSGEPAESTGQVATFISTLGTPVPKEQMRATIQAGGHALAGVVALTGPRVHVEEANVAQLVARLQRFFVQLTAAYPYRTGISVFLGGPSSLALAAGLALNPNQFLGGGRTIELAEYTGGPYHPSLRLPLDVSPDTTIPRDSKSVALRLTAFRHFKTGVEALQEDLAHDTVFMPAGFGGSDDASGEIRDRAIHALRELCLPDEPEGEAFEVNLLKGTLTVGNGLLHPLVELPADTLARLGQLFALHELVHADQGIESHNYRGIGRSGVVLEEVDFWADAFAIGTAALHETQRAGPAGEGKCAEILTAFIQAHIAAMRAFDQMELGSKTLRVMPERRLRRYLIWYLQRARATAVKEPAHIRALLNHRLVTELAPLRGRLDMRYDKIVESGLKSTTLSFSIGGCAKRMAALPENFSPTDLVEAVRAFDETEIDDAMGFVVKENRTLLVPWLR